MKSNVRVPPTIAVHEADTDRIAGKLTCGYRAKKPTCCIRALAALEPEVHPAPMQTIADRINVPTSRFRFRASSLSIFVGGLALASFTVSAVRANSKSIDEKKFAVSIYSGPRVQPDFSGSSKFYKLYQTATKKASNPV